MTKERFDAIARFTQELPTLRIRVADGQLLDRCEQALKDLIEFIGWEFEEGPRLNGRKELFVEAPPPEDVKPPPPAGIFTLPVPKKRSHHKKKVT